MVNHIISKSSKLAQKEFKSRHDSIEKMIYWELCKRLKFDHIHKWHIHKSESAKKLRCIKFSNR